MLSKTDLDLKVAVDLETSQRRVAEITSLFIKHIRQALVTDGEVVLPGLGRLHVLEYLGPSAELTQGRYKKGVRAGKMYLDRPLHLKVFFKKAPALRDALKRRKQR